MLDATRDTERVLRPPLRPPLRRRPPRPAAQPRPYPLEPLLEACGSAAALATVAGVTRRQVGRWARTGLTEAQADHLAVAAGLHPGSVWPTWWRVGSAEGG